MKVFKTLLLALLLITATVSFAQIKLPAFFGDHMVLQQNSNVSIWGTDKPNAKIKITGSWGKESSASANTKGQWKLKIQTPPYGGPYTLGSHFKLQQQSDTPVYCKKGHQPGAIEKCGRTMGRSQPGHRKGL